MSEEPNQVHETTEANMANGKPEKARNDLASASEAQELQRGWIDRIGDFFAKMVKGIFIFAFWRLPYKLWQILTDIEQLKKLLKWLKSIIRMVFWVVSWIVLIFLGWWIFLKETFIRFWIAVQDLFLQFWYHTLIFLKANAGWIWMIIALMGSAYGLLYVTLKRRAKKKGKEFSGVFGWLHKKNGNESSTNENGGDLNNERKQA